MIVVLLQCKDTTPASPKNGCRRLWGLGAGSCELRITNYEFGITSSLPAADVELLNDETTFGDRRESQLLPLVELIINN